MQQTIQKNSTLTIALLYGVAIVLGLVNGFYGTELTQHIGDFTSSVFIRLFKFISIPIIAVSIIATLAQLGQNKESGRIFGRTITYTLSTTVIAGSIAALLYWFVQPANVQMALPTETPEVMKNFSGSSYLQYVQSIIPDNFLAPFLSANVLSVLLVSAAIGLAIAKIPNRRPREVVVAFFQGAQQILFVLVGWLIRVLPIGIFGFISVLCTELQAGVDITGLGQYFGIIMVANFLQMFVVLPLFLKMKGISPFAAMRAMLPAITVAFFSKSSAGTLPVTMQCAEQNLKVHPKVARFTIPICTTINMNACAAFILTTVVYLMQNAGADITPLTLLTWVLIATIAAVGNAGVPMGCFFLSASLLASMEVPILLLGVILPFYAVLDMFETALNVWSDSCVAKAVDRDLYPEKEG